jgi:hypothetical protein
MPESESTKSLPVLDLRRVDAAREKPAFLGELGARLGSEVPLLTPRAHFAAQARGVTEDPLNPLFREAGRNTLKGRLHWRPDVAPLSRRLLELSDGKPEVASACRRRSIPFARLNDKGP